MPNIEISVLEDLACGYLVAAGSSKAAAQLVTRSIVRAEAEGNTACGLFYLSVFKQQLAQNKIDGQAVPQILKQSDSSILVDAANGFAHPAIGLATKMLIEASRKNGIAAAGITRSYNALSLAHHVLPLAEAGLIGLCCSNAPASVAPPGGTKAIVGTNPMAFAVPGEEGPALVIDQSASTVTKTRILMHEDCEEPIPEGWAQDNHGQPTNDPSVGLAGSLLPFGGQKGANIGLIVEVLSAVLTGASLSTAAPSFSGHDAGFPNVGQFLLAIDPTHFAGAAIARSMEELALKYRASGVRLPGQKFRTDGPAAVTRTIDVNPVLWKELTATPPSAE
ncbi:Ldh family oxidoreductase [Kiloniella sp.]|uniref:Ldh family oxidoreductase n=1 Tax=Kiloniella sp. TaxID=1938587 RepID=UPI003B019D12